MRSRLPERSLFDSLDILSRFDTMQRVPRGRPGAGLELPAGRSRHASMKGPSQCYLAWGCKRLRSIFATREIRGEYSRPS
jgi:hypothetical protein